MNLLAFLAEPGFVIPWYLIGAAGAVWVAYDLARVNTPLKTAMKWAWPIIVFFFSVIGLALYLATARAPGVAQAASRDEKKRLHDTFERSMVRRVNGAVIHCVAGDGLGIMTAMVIARLLNLAFWQEFWFEYAVGFAFGLFIFQLKAMTMMTDSLGRALWMAFRAEFFSMLTVMGGMGAVMAWVTPLAVGAQPQPGTAAFWGFGMLGLLVGYVFTFPMNWMLVKVGWKHGMGSMEGARKAGSAGVRRGLFATMAVLGVAALALPAWLAVRREAQPLSLAGTGLVGGSGTSAPAAAPSTALAESLAAAGRHLDIGQRREGVAALDAAMRVAMVLHARDAQAAQPLLDGIRRARREVQNGKVREAVRRIAALHPPALADALSAEPPDPRAYEGVKLVDAHGAIIGAVSQVEPQRVQLALGGAHHVLGFWNGPPQRQVWVPAGQVVFGPRQVLGKSYAMLISALPA